MTRKILHHGLNARVNGEKVIRFNRGMVLLLMGLICSACGDDENGPAITVVAHFLRSDPPNGGFIFLDCCCHPCAYKPPVTLYFDRSPASVTVNGLPAEVKDTVATWTPTVPFDGGMRVRWKNPDGSEGAGTEIVLTVQVTDCNFPQVMGGNVRDGDKDVDGDVLNAEGITLEFSMAVEGVEIYLSQDGTPLHWTAEWTDKSVRLVRGDGEKLVNETEYFIEGTVKDFCGNIVRLRIVFVTQEA